MNKVIDIFPLCVLEPNKKRGKGALPIWESWLSLQIKEGTKIVGERCKKLSDGYRKLLFLLKDVQPNIRLRVSTTIKFFQTILLL